MNQQMNEVQKRAYDFAFEEEVSVMSVEDFLRWNSHCTRAYAQERIESAKQVVASALGPLL